MRSEASSAFGCDEEGGLGKAFPEATEHQIELGYNAAQAPESVTILGQMHALAVRVQVTLMV
jgi:hypothetical protein